MTRFLSFALAGLLVAACAGEPEETPSTEDGPPAATRSDTLAGALDPSSDTGGSAPDDGGAAPGGADPGAEPGDPAALPDGWSHGPLRGGQDREQGPVAILRSVRTGRNDGFDRVVFEFDNHVPAYHVRYVEQPVACGSGHDVEPGAPAALEVDFRPAAAHDDEGRGTVGQREISTGLAAIPHARITCDFEAIVTWVLGVDRRAPIRVLELGSPARLAVDVLHR